MSRCKMILALLLVGALFAGQALADSFNGVGRGKSEEAAVSAAANNAVEQAVKQLLDEGTYKKNKKKIEQLLKGKKAKLVSAVRQHDEPEFTGAGYEAKVSAEVDLKALEHEISSLGLLQEALGNPRIMVLYNPKLPQGGRLGLSSEELEGFFDNSYGALVDGFVERGFDVIDKKSAENFAIQVADSHEIDIEVNQAAVYGLKYHADLIVYYQTVGVTREGSQAAGAKVFLRAQLINPTTSRILASKDVEAHAVAGSVQEALYQAAKDAGTKISRVMAESMKKHSKKEKSLGGTFIVVLDGVEEVEDAVAFRDKLKSFPELGSARDRESGGGKTTYEIRCEGSADDVKSAVLKASRELGWKLKLVRAEGSRSTWKRQ